VEADEQGAEAADTADPIRALTISPLHLFTDWPTGDVPRSGAVVSTIWNHDGSFIYVGMLGVASQAEPRATGRLDLQGGSTAMPAGDGVVISSVSMSCRQPRLKQRRDCLSNKAGLRPPNPLIRLYLSRGLSDLSRLF
jgi:hypothetical protein